MKKLIPLVILILFSTMSVAGKGFRKRTCGYYQKRFFSHAPIKKTKEKNEFRKLIRKYKQQQEELEYYKQKEAEEVEATCCGNIKAKDVRKGLATAAAIGIPVVIGIIQFLIPLIPLLL